RRRVAAQLDAPPEAVVFTSGGTESNALALWTLLGAGGANGIVTTGVEHPAVSDTLGRWERAGAARVITVPPGPHGRVDAERVLAAVDSGTCAVAMIAANNETG